MKADSGQIITIEWFLVTVMKLFDSGTLKNFVAQILKENIVT